MSNDQKAVIKAATEYAPPAWLSILITIAKAVRWLTGLTVAGSMFAGLLDTKWGMIIFAGVYGLGKVTELVGDFVDNQKFDDSFKRLLENNP